MTAAGSMLAPSALKPLVSFCRGALPEARGGCRLCIWEEGGLKLCLTPRFSAAGEGRGEAGGQSKAAPGRLINSGCQERGCSALGSQTLTSPHALSCCTETVFCILYHASDVFGVVWLINQPLAVPTLLFHYSFFIAGAVVHLLHPGVYFSLLFRLALTSGGRQAFVQEKKTTIP